jgi:predicted nuclease with TOPRIM domain
MDENERLGRIENKLDKILDAVGALEKNDAAQGERLKRLEEDLSRHSKTFDRYFERLEVVEKVSQEIKIKLVGFDDIKKRILDIENKAAKNALAVWIKIGGIALSVAVTAIITLILVRLGVK